MQPQAPAPFKRLATRIAAVLLLACSASHANVVTYASSQNLSFPGSNINGSFNLQQFNPSLGTLTGVSITVGLRDWDGVFTFRHTDAVTFGQNALAGIRMVTNLPSLTSLSTYARQDLTPNGSLYFVGSTLSIEDTIDPVAPASGTATATGTGSWATSQGFIGSGAKSISYSIISSKSYATTGNITSYTMPMSGALDTSVSYTYDPVAAVPEPSEWALGSVMLAWGAGWMWRRARQRARNS